MTEVPTMDALLKGAPKNWGKWGDEDEVGALNYLTAEEVFRGVRHIKSGSVFTLQRLIGDPKGDPVWPGRTPAERTQVLDESDWDEGGKGPAFPGGLHYADDKISAFLQGSTQYDGLGHVWYDGQLWNGYDARSTVGGLDKASVAPIAERGVVGRGILLDMARFRGKENLDKAETFTHEDLMACAEAQGTKIEKHDILIIRTNFLKLFFDLGETFYEGFCEPGLVYSPELVQWFHDMEIPNLVTDTIANEVTTDPNKWHSTSVALRLDAQPRCHADRDLRPGEVGLPLCPGRAVHVPLRSGPVEGEPGERLARQPPGDQVTTYTERPWSRLYSKGLPADITQDYATMLDLFNASVTRAPDNVAIKYFDGVLTMADLDVRSDALAVALIDNGFAAGAEQEMIEFCKQQMAAYKYPRSIQFVDDLPKTATGKILRRELRGPNS